MIVAVTVSKKFVSDIFTVTSDITTVILCVTVVISYLGFLYLQEIFVTNSEPS